MMQEGHSARHRGRLLRWEAIDHPAIWLAYLPLFFIPWLIEVPSPAQMVWAGLGLAVFLAVYFVSLKAAGTRLVGLAIAALLLSFALAFTGSNWTVIAVYAAAMIADLRPARWASLGVGAFAAASAGLALATGQPAIYWVLGVFLMIMVGIGNISRAALQDKNRALAAAQGEVRQLAAAAERERIGRDLHDLLGRTLTLIALKADLAARLTNSAPEKAADEISDIAAAAREGLAEMREAVSGMTGASLAREIAGSRAALAAAGIVCEVEGSAEAIDPGTSAVLAMALREAVTNVIRHSDARTCRIALIQQPGGLELKVSDDGDGQAVRPGGGLAGLTARLTAAGGELAVEGDTRGTRVTARVPQGAAA
jgi:two-component system sensor histidine kinase DesK